MRIAKAGLQYARTGQAHAVAVCAKRMADRLDESDVALKSGRGIIACRSVAAPLPKRRKRRPDCAQAVKNGRRRGGKRFPAANRHMFDKTHVYRELLRQPRE